MKTWQKSHICLGGVNCNVVLPGTAETSPEKKITQVFEEKMKREQTLTVARVNHRLLWAICDRLILPKTCAYLYFGILKCWYFERWYFEHWYFETLPHIYVYRVGFPDVRDVKCINVTSKLGPPGATYSSQKV